MGRTRETGNLVSENAIYKNIDNDRVGIGSTLPSTLLDVAGTISGNDANISGIVTASGGFSIGISSSGDVITSGPIKTLNFVGTGNTFSVNGTSVDISISSGGSDITIQDEGSVIGTAATTINFVGSGVAASYSSGITTVTITGGGGGGSNPWTRKTANYTAVAGDQLIADTTGGTFTITLPSSPSSGDSVKVADGGDWASNNLTIDRNGSNIEGSTDNFVLDIRGIIVEFVYEDATDGWQVYANTGPGAIGGTGDILEVMLFG